MSYFISATATSLIVVTLLPFLPSPKPKKPLFPLHSSKMDHAAATSASSTPGLSKTAQKKLLKQQKFEAKRAEKKAEAKAHKKSETDRKRKEWEEKLSALSEEEKIKVMESRKELRKERMDRRAEEKHMKVERLNAAKMSGLNVVIDLEFSELMAPNQINSLVQQVHFHSPFSYFNPLFSTIILHS